MDLLIMIMYLSKYKNLIINDNNHNFYLRKKDESEGSRNWWVIKELALIDDKRERCVEGRKEGDVGK
jgi:hypothetical protein